MTNGWRASGPPPTTTRSQGQARPRLTNPWLQGNYDPDEFYVRATNAQDHSDRLTVKVRPDFLVMVQQLIASRQLPQYATPADFFRDAAIHRYQYLQDQLTDPSYRDRFAHLYERIHLEEMVDAMEREYTGNLELLEKLTAMWARLAEFGDWQALKISTDEAEERIDAHREPMRSKVLMLVAEYRARIPADFTLDES